MKHYVLLLVATILSGCLSEKEGDLEPDCTESDLLVVSTEVVNSTCDERGSLTVMGTGGTHGYEYSLDGSTFQQDPEFSDLTAGEYTVTIRDNMGCTATTSASVEANQGSVVAVVDSVDPSRCGETQGAVTLTASGGEGSYQYQVDEGGFSDSPTVNGLGAGSHTYTVRDEAGCADSGTFQVLTSTSLADDIMPIILSNCATSSSCHASGASGRPVFEAKSAVISRAANIKNRTSSGSMPPIGSPDLTQAEIDLIACWVDDGAENN